MTIDELYTDTANTEAENFDNADGEFWKGLFSKEGEDGDKEFDSEKAQNTANTILGLLQIVTANKNNSGGGGGTETVIVEKSNTGLIVGISVVALLGLGTAIYFGVKK
jgi:hypothetical protein